MMPTEMLWLSDWYLGLAGQELHTFPQGCRAYPSRSWLDMPESHRVWLHTPFQGPIAQFPGGAPLHIKVANPSPWEYWFPHWQPAWQESYSEQGLWLPASKLPTQAGPLRLEAMRSESQWQQLHHYQRLRAQAEGENPAHAERMTAFQHFRAPHLEGHWYLAWDQEQPVASGGIFHIQTPQGPFMRLQDIEVFPSHRGQGYGDQLLTSLLYLAQGTQGVGVRADVLDWPLTWYQRRGFETVANWVHWAVA